MSKIVKRCPKCRIQLTLDALVRGEQVEAIGLLQIAEAPELTSYYFTHTRSGCLTTFAVSVRAFDELAGDPRRGGDAGGGQGCAQHCGRAAALAACDAQCLNARFRRFFLEVLRRPREGR